MRLAGREGIEGLARAGRPVEHAGQAMAPRLNWRRFSENFGE